MEQRLAGKKLKVWQGCLLVVLVAVFLFAAQFVLTFVQYALTYFRILPAQTAYTIASVAYCSSAASSACAFCATMCSTSSIQPIPNSCRSAASTARAARA